MKILQKLFSGMFLLLFFNFLSPVDTVAAERVKDRSMFVESAGSGARGPVHVANSEVRIRDLINVFMKKIEELGQASLLYTSAAWILFFLIIGKLTLGQILAGTRQERISVPEKQG